MMAIMDNETREEIFKLCDAVVTMGAEIDEALDDLMAIEGFVRYGNNFGKRKEMHDKAKDAFKLVSEQYSIDYHTLLKKQYELFLQIVELLPNQTRFTLGADYANNGKVIGRYDESSGISDYYVVTIWHRKTDVVIRMECRKEPEEWERDGSLYDYQQVNVVRMEIRPSHKNKGTNYYANRF